MSVLMCQSVRSEHSYSIQWKHNEQTHLQRDTDNSYDVQTNWGSISAVCSDIIKEQRQSLMDKTGVPA